MCGMPPGVLRKAKSVMPTYQKLFLKRPKFYFVKRQISGHSNWCGIKHKRRTLVYVPLLFKRRGQRDKALMQMYGFTPKQRMTYLGKVLGWILVMKSV